MRRKTKTKFYQDNIIIKTEIKNSVIYSYSVFSIKIFNIRFMNCLLYSTPIVRYSSSGIGKFKNANQINVYKLVEQELLTLPGHMSSSPICLNGVRVVECCQITCLHIFNFML